MQAKYTSNGRGDLAVPTIPKATGSYVALARGLTAQSAFLALSSHARLTLLVAERELPACGTGDLPPPLLAAKAGLPDDQVTDALAELEAAGWLYQVEGYAILPHLLDMVKGTARGRTIYEVRQLPEDVQAILRQRHRWVMGRREKSVENSNASLPRVTIAPEPAPARNQPTNQPTNTPPTPPPRGIVEMWYQAFDGQPPSEPKATHPDAYRRTTLTRATEGETEADIERAFASWAAATDPDWGGHGGGGVGSFAAAVGRWIERRNIERQHRRNPVSQSDMQTPAPMTVG